MTSQSVKFPTSRPVGEGDPRLIQSWPRVPPRSQPTPGLLREFARPLSSNPISAEDCGLFVPSCKSFGPASDSREISSRDAVAKSSVTGSNMLGWLFFIIVFTCVDSGKTMADAWALFQVQEGEIAFLLVFLQSAMSSCAGVVITTSQGGLQSFKQIFSPQGLLRFFPAAVCYSLSQAALVWAFTLGLTPATSVVLGFLFMPACTVMSRYIFLRRYGWLETLALAMLTFSAITFAELRNSKMETQTVFLGREMLCSFSSTVLAAFGSLLVEKGVKAKYTPEARFTRYYVQKTQIDLGNLLVSGLALVIVRLRSGQNLHAGWDDKMYLALALRTIQSWMAGLFTKRFSTTSKEVVRSLSLLVIYFIGDRIVMELHEGKPLAPFSKEFTVDVLAIVVALSALLFQMGRQRTSEENPSTQMVPEPPDSRSFCPSEFEERPGMPTHSRRLPMIPALMDGRLFNRAWIEHLRTSNGALLTWLSSFAGKSTQFLCVVSFIVASASKTIVSEQVMSSNANVTSQTMVVAVGGISIFLGLAISASFDGWKGLKGAIELSDIFRSFPIAFCFSLSQTATALAFSLKISGAVNGVLGYFSMPLTAILGRFFLGRTYSLLQCLGMLIITLSAIVFATLMAEEGPSAVSMKAIGWCLVAVIFGCVGGLLCEKLMKENGKPYYQQKTFLDISGTFTSFLMLFVVPLIDKRPTADFMHPRKIDGVEQQGFFVGWDWKIVACVLVNVLQAFMGGMVAKQLSSVTKSVASCVALLIVYFVGELVVKQKPFYWPIGSMAIVLALSVLVFTWSDESKKQARATTTGDQQNIIEEIDELSPTLTIGKKRAIVTAEVGIDLETVLAAKPFRNWVETISKENRVEVSKVHFQSVDMFGKNVGFLKFKADAKVDGKAVPGITFMRGGSVAILVILYHEGREYTLVVRQPRVAVCSSSFVEIPAGMLDGEGNFAGVAAKEMKEETGIQIIEDDLIDMTHETYQDKYPGVFPSCGGSDEFNRFFLYRKVVTADELASLNGKLTGVLEEGEMIKLQIIPLEALWRSSADAKALVALCLYRKLHEQGRIQKRVQTGNAQPRGSSLLKRWLLGIACLIFVFGCSFAFFTGRGISPDNTDDISLTTITTTTTSTTTITSMTIPRDSPSGVPYTENFATVSDSSMQEPNQDADTVDHSADEIQALDAVGKKESREKKQKKKRQEEQTNQANEELRKDEGKKESREKKQKRKRQEEQTNQANEELRKDEEASHLRNLKWRWAEHQIPVVNKMWPKTRFEDKWNMPADRVALKKELEKKVEDKSAAVKQYETRAVEFADVDYPERRMTFTDFRKAIDWLMLESNIQGREDL